MSSYQGPVRKFLKSSVTVSTLVMKIRSLFKPRLQVTLSLASTVDTWCVSPNLDGTGRQIHCPSSLVPEINPHTSILGCQDGENEEVLNLVWLTEESLAMWLSTVMPN